MPAARSERAALTCGNVLDPDVIARIPKAVSRAHTTTMSAMLPLPIHRFAPLTILGARGDK
jgi:hypothetical protein